MNRAKDVLFRVTLPVAIMVFVGFLAAAIVSFVMGSPAQTQYLIGEVEAGRIVSDFPGTVEEKVAAIQIMFSILGGVYLIPVIASVVNGFLSTFALTRESKALYIANIIFGFMMLDVPTNAVAGIFGLILLARKNKAKPEEKPAE